LGCYTASHISKINGLRGRKSQNAKIRGRIGEVGLVGRWVRHLPEKVFHDDIGKATPYAYETALGWAFHYLVGILYGVILVVLAGAGWLAAPTFMPAFILGIVTVGAGWFLLAPGMGAGWAASKLPNPMLVRTLNLVSHTVFALGLFSTALLIR